MLSLVAFVRLTCGFGWEGLRCITYSAKLMKIASIQQLQQTFADKTHRSKPRKAKEEKVNPALICVGF